MYETLAVEREGHLTWLTLSRPDALNALSRTMVRELRDFFAKLGDDRETRVVVVRGAGRAVCAGLDLKAQGAGEGGETGVAAGLRAQRQISDLVVLMRRAPQPIVAAVRGAAAGGGFAIALAADVRIAGESARMNAAFIRLGLSACDVGVSYFLPRLVGVGRAMELAFSNRRVSAQEAVSIGLAERILEGSFEEMVFAEVQKLAHGPTVSYGLMKRELRASLDNDLVSQLALEAGLQSRAAATADLIEGITAFKEKRAPRFNGA